MEHFAKEVNKYNAVDGYPRGLSEQFPNAFEQFPNDFEQFPNNFEQFPNNFLFAIQFLIKSVILRMILIHDMFDF